MPHIATVVFVRFCDTNYLGSRRQPLPLDHPIRQEGAKNTSAGTLVGDAGIRIESWGSKGPGLPIG